MSRTFAKFTRIKNKDFYYIGSSIDTSKTGIDRYMGTTVQGFLDCVENVKVKEIVYGTGLTDPDDSRYSDVLKEAYEMGKKYKEDF